MFTARFWRDATERAIKTGAQALVLIVGANQFDILHADYLTVGGMGLTAVLLSYLTSLASEKVTQNESGSILKD